MKQPDHPSSPSGQVGEVETLWRLYSVILLELDIAKDLQYTALVATTKFTATTSSTRIFTAMETIENRCSIQSVHLPTLTFHYVQLGTLSHCCLEAQIRIQQLQTSETKNCWIASHLQQCIATSYRPCCLSEHHTSPCCCRCAWMHMCG